MVENKTSVIKVKINPRSSTNDINYIMDDGTIKINITAPPVDGKANQALKKLLSKELGISEDSVQIIAGQTSHTKLIKIIGLENSEIIKKLRK